jgi:NAD(P)-dependent dehydrogenase (short-subunit alcohol dehydrogenase family)
MAARGTGAIVNVTSIQAFRPAPALAHYSAAKAGLEMLTRSAALELGPSGVRVNAVAPGLIWREGLETAWPEGVARFSKASPLGRVGRPEEVADACLFLASSAARFVTGTTLVVDGGVLAGPAF